MPESKLRVFVTGTGVQSPIGNDTETFWKNLTAGMSGAAPITRFDASDFGTRFACEVKDFSTDGVIAGTLKKGGKVQIAGFGNFETRKRAARQGRNPQTGATIQIKASTVPAFRPAKALKDLVNKKK